MSLAGVCQSPAELEGCLLVTCVTVRDVLRNFPKGGTGSADDETLNRCDSFEADTNCPSLTHMKLVQAQRRMISYKPVPAVYKKKPQRNSGTSKCPFLGMLESFKDICMNL